ncbi:MAG: hypothetical protein WBW73_06700 [Rhodoplanes sp.]
MFLHRNRFALRKLRNRLPLLLIFCREPLPERLDRRRARLFRCETTGLDLRLAELDRADDELAVLDRKPLAGLRRKPRRWIRPGDQL